MQITQNHIIEFAAFMTSVICWDTMKQGKLRWFPLFLFFILVVEIIGAKYKTINTIIYNLSIPVEYMFYLFLFWMHGNTLLKGFIKVAYLSLICAAFFYFIYQPIFVFHNYVLVVGQVCVVIASCFYFYEKFQIDEETSLLRNYFFWIASGLLLFNLADMSYFLLYDKMHLDNWGKYDKLFKSINSKMLIVLYVCYIIGMLIQKRFKNNDRVY